MRVASYALVDTAAIAIPIGSAKVSILSTNGIGENKLWVTFASVTKLRLMSTAKVISLALVKEGHVASPPCAIKVGEIHTSLSITGRARQLIY